MVLSDRAKEALSKLSPEAKERLTANPELIDLELERREKYWPIKDAIPNVAQERALLCYAARHPTYPGGYPFINIFRAGNGVGKTCSLAWLIGGVSLGAEFMNKEYFNYQYFAECQDIRKKRRFKLRIVCDKADMQENGSVYQELSKWLPIAKFEGKTSGGYFTTIRIPAPSPLYFETVIDIKTFDMDVVAHAGPDYDLIVFNEPAPKDKYNENVGRCRKGGRIALFLTPLNQAEYLHKIESGVYPDGEVHIGVGSIWDNCVDIPGKRGTLSKHDIERMIRQWYENDPMEVPARENGDYMHLAGAVYKIFNDEVHVIDPMTVDPSWNIYKIIDPHDTKPPYCCWIAVTPMNRIYVIAEYPTEPWDQIKGTVLTIDDFVHEFKLVEQGKNEKFQYLRNNPLRTYECLGDPNKFKDRQPNTGLTMKQEYEVSGCESIITNINDDVALGHSKVRGLLRYDPMRKVDTLNSPKLFVFRSCTNMIRAFKNFQYKTKQGDGAGESDKLDKKWECPMGTMRYFAVHFDGYQHVKQDYYGDEWDEEMEEIESGRRAGYMNERFI